MIKIISEEDRMKLKICNENCIGLDYCGGCNEDGEKCQNAPSIEIIKDILKK